MNFLAHALLSCETPEALVGGFLGDFVKGVVPEDLSPAVRAAIVRHRAVDRYTDAHAIVRASCALVAPARRRFAGVLVDIFYDHFLARHWPRFHPTPLAEFTAWTYGALTAHESILPPRLLRILPYMRGDNWLEAYGTREGVADALYGLTRRLSRFPRARVLAQGVEDLDAHYGPLERQFLEFFPQLRAFVAAAAPVPAVA